MINPFVKNDLTIGEIKGMSFFCFKEKMLSNFRGLNKKKYFFYFIIIIISSFALWVFTKDNSLVFFLFVLFLLFILGDLLFDSLGYFKDTEDIKKISIAKKILGYIIGTIIFACIIAMLLRIFDSLF